MTDDDAELHEVVLVDTTKDVYRSGPAQRYGFCIRTGCRWRWDGIGSFDFAKQRHEKLNRTEERT